MARKQRSVTHNFKRDYGRRLTETMIEQGYIAPRSKLGASPKALQEAAGVNSIEMARKYLTGQSMPSPEIRARIAAWLGVCTAWLDYGELPKYPADKVTASGDRIDPESLSACISAVQAAAKATGLTYSDRSLANAAAFLYQEVVTGGKLDQQRIIDLLKILN